ncbi:hypothetical protein AB1M41_12865 [Bacillus inaquosorum]|uniref:hypothetical protein n=1 Tax=Bacillus inaquosorum TaxID=483913 RepID=UPI0034CF1512
MKKLSKICYWNAALLLALLLASVRAVRTKNQNNLQIMILLYTHIHNSIHPITIEATYSLYSEKLFKF